MALVLADSEAALVSKEVLDLTCADITTGVAVKSLERGVWCKVPDLAKSLTSSFEILFSVADGCEEVLESMFRFVSKHVFYKKSDMRVKKR